LLGQQPGIALIDVQTEKRRNFKLQSPVHSLAFSPDGKFLLAGSADNNVRLWSLKPDRFEREFKGHRRAVDQVAFARDGKRIFSASTADGTLGIWENDKDTKEAKQLLKTNGTAQMTCTAFWRGDRAVSGHDDGSVVVWDLSTGVELQRFEGKRAKTTAVAISPDGFNALAALSDGQVYLYRLPPPHPEP
jgi:WD40 repeat protein